MGPFPQVGVKAIFLTTNFGKSNEQPIPDIHSYDNADVILRDLCLDLDLAANALVHAVVVYKDLFIWSTNIVISRALATRTNFIQTAIQADWEFNGGVRPGWWPAGHEADRMWGVHFREDRENGRADVARMRLGRYDLRPVTLTPLPPRD